MATNQETQEAPVTKDRLYEFAVESDKIENIHEERRHKTHHHALQAFLALPKIEIIDLEKFVRILQPNAYLRTKPEHVVYIGGREAPPASISFPGLKELLNKVNYLQTDAYTVHLEYENYHPFIDGNGRSGRALWLWMMSNYEQYALQYGFLRMWYYQTLKRHKE